jgi:hypothetical protein
MSDTLGSGRRIRVLTIDTVLFVKSIICVQRQRETQFPNLQNSKNQMQELSHRGPHNDHWTFVSLT